jgi:hypothetical protein
MELAAEEELFDALNLFLSGSDVCDANDCCIFPELEISDIQNDVSNIYSDVKGSMNTIILTKIF